MYYTEFDWLPDDEIETLLPESGVHESLVIKDFADAREPTGLSRTVFQDWLREGCHDCVAAQAVLRFWNATRRASDHDTVADLFNQLYAEYI